MIFLSDINSVIESIYLESGTSESIKESSIYINPERITYLTGKTIIINTSDYPETSITQLVHNNNTVISRLGSLVQPEVKYQPYIIRPNFNIMWNGEEISGNLESALESCYFNAANGKLLFPKIISLELPVVDTNGDLTALGWVCHQVGCNIDLRTPFQDLDILKTKKWRF